MKYVVGIISDGNEVLLINDNPINPTEGMYNGIYSFNMQEESPEESLSYKCYQVTKKVIEEWKELETEILDDESVLIYYSALISTNELDKIRDLAKDTIFFFTKEDLPSNIDRQLAFHINNVLHFTKSTKHNINTTNNNKFNNLLLISVVVLFFLCLVLMLIGKTTNNSFLYYFTSDATYNIDDDKIKEFKDSFKEKMKSSY